MIEKYRAIEYLLEKLDGGLECHCDIFRKIYGMKPGTAERRLREWRDTYKWEEFRRITMSGHPGRLLITGYTAHRSAHKWTFTRPFLKFLKKQIKAAEKLEKQNAKVKHEN